MSVVVSLSVDYLQASAAVVRSLPDFRGKGRLAFAAWAKLSHEGEFTVSMRLGHKISAPRTSRTTWLAAMTGRYDDELLVKAFDHIEPGTVALDVGGCFGLWTVPLARHAASVGATVRVFEPVRSNLAVLKANIAMNNLQSVVQVHPYALGSEESRAIVDVEEGVGNATIIDSSHKTAYAEEVEVRSLDDEPFDSRCSFIKLDVEGYEMEVLEGAAKLIERDQPVIFGEFNTGSLSRRTDRRTMDYKTWAEKHGYALVGLVARRPIFGKADIVSREPEWPATIAMLPKRLTRT